MIRMEMTDPGGKEMSLVVVGLDWADMARLFMGEVVELLPGPGVPKEHWLDGAPRLAIFARPTEGQIEEAFGPIMNSPNAEIHDYSVNPDSN